MQSTSSLGHAPGQSTLRSISTELVAHFLIPAILATTIAFILVALSPGLAATIVIVAILIAGGVALGERSRPSDAIVLVGRTPMASVLAVSIEQAQPTAARSLIRADHLGEAARLARTTPCREIVLVGDIPRSTGALIDSRGRTLPIVAGAEKLERLLNRIPLEFATEDHWLSALGSERPLARPYAILKRGIDVTVACSIALALLPLFPLIALAIKLDSRGPILYSQTRVGLGGRTFRIYKFRTMGTDAEANGAVWATKQDPRITRTGRFMRKTRLDELPQLWNLIRGDMALVGPRPERPEFTSRLAEEIPGYELRHTVKPGLTGWAQVCYRYTSSIRDTRNKVEYDLYYVKHCTLLMDLKIMLRTVKVVVAMKGQ